MFITTFYLLLNQVIKLSSQEVQPGVGKRKVTIKLIMAKRGQTNIHNTVQIICSYKW